MNSTFLRIHRAGFGQGWHDALDGIARQSLYLREAERRLAYDAGYDACVDGSKSNWVAFREFRESRLAGELTK